MSHGTTSTIKQRMLLAAAAIAAALSLGAVGAPARQSDDPDRYSRTVWEHVTGYVGPSGRLISDYRYAEFAVARAQYMEVWASARHGGRIERSLDGPAYLPTAADRRAWKKAGSPDLDKLMGPVSLWGPRGHDLKAAQLDTYLLGGGELARLLPKGDPLRGLPTDRAALAKAIETIALRQRTELSGEGDAACLADPQVCSAALWHNASRMMPYFAISLLEYPFTPTRLRAALIGALRAIPGTISHADVRDIAGRAGQKIVIPGAESSSPVVVLVDISDARALAEGSIRPGTGNAVTWGVTYGLQRTTVEHLGDRPHPDCAPKTPGGSAARARRSVRLCV